MRTLGALWGLQRLRMEEKTLSVTVAAGTAVIMNVHYSCLHWVWITPTYAIAHCVISFCPKQQYLLHVMGSIYKLTWQL